MARLFWSRSSADSIVVPDDESAVLKVIFEKDRSLMRGECNLSFMGRGEVTCYHNRITNIKLISEGQLTITATLNTVKYVVDRSYNKVNAYQFSYTIEHGNEYYLFIANNLEVKVYSEEQYL